MFFSKKFSTSFCKPLDFSGLRKNFFSVCEDCAWSALESFSVTGIATRVELLVQA
tara:strand:+ start:9269 stop:9433 length:165 start_codon:yes stop_codon:yes gene_type:complete